MESSDDFFLLLMYFTEMAPTLLLVCVCVCGGGGGGGE